MKDQRGPVWLTPSPPRAVLRAMNVVARPLLRSRFGARMSGVMLLEFRGRRTGRALAVPVDLHVVDGVPMAFTNAGWRHDFAGGLPVTVTHRGEVHVTTGTLVPMSAAAMGVAVRTSLDAGGSARRMGIRTEPGHEPTAEELAALGPELGTAVIALDVRLSPPAGRRGSSTRRIGSRGPGRGSATGVPRDVRRRAPAARLTERSPR